MEEVVTHAIIIPPLILVLCLLYFIRIHRRNPALHHIPAVGVLSYAGAIEFLFSANRLIHEGYHRYRTSAFKVAQFSRWIVVITGSHLIEEFKRVTEDDLPYSDVALEESFLKHTGISIKRSDLTLMCTQHTRNLPLVFPNMRNEVVATFQDVVSKDSTSEWTSVLVVNMTVEIVSRVYNRALVGPQGCRDPALTEANQRFLWAKTHAVVAIFKPLQLTRGCFNRVHELLVPIIEERRLGTQSPKKEDSHDLLSFLISGTHSSREITRSVVALNYQAVVPTALTIVDALYHLALANSREVVEPMREEVGTVVRKFGWTPKAFEHMRKVDSFLKEPFDGDLILLLVTAQRKTRRPYTFSDGTYVPAGTVLSLATCPTHNDPTRYVLPEMFDAFRFARDDGPRHELATTTPDFLAWGYGRTTCPGKFVAAVMMKLIFAHVVLRYDVKLRDERPRARWFGTERLLDVKAEMLFRRRG